MKSLRRAVMASLILASVMSPAVAATGGAVFEQMADAKIPLPFHGIWAPQGRRCGGTRPAPGALRINADGIVEADGAMSALRIWLNPGDAPHYDHAIVDVLASGGGGEWEESLILHLGQGGRVLFMRQKGEDEAKATTYRKCTR